jgi:NTE family protein/lysophospholipid hydrolase
MHNATLTPELEALLIENRFHDPFTAAAFADLRSVLRHTPLARGATLLRQGDPDRDVYLILRGRLGVQAEHANGTSTLVDEVGPGSLVGEMALLTGQPRTATVFAVEDSDLARVSREDFERLALRHPEALNEFLRRIVPRMRGTQLAHLLTEVFGALERDVLADIAAQLEWVQLRSGERLFGEGDAGDDVYLVSHGRLRVSVADGDGSERVLEEVGRGGTIGDIALLTGEPRAATVHAVRDTYLLRLTRAAYDALLVRHPLAMMEIARRAVTRLRHASRRHMEDTSRPVTFALIGAGPDVPLSAFGERLAQTLAAFGRTQKLDAAEVDRLLAKPGIAQSGDDNVVHESLNQWLGAQESGHAAVVFVADEQVSPWTRRCLMHADRVLIVGRAGADAAPGPVERAFHALGLKTRAELVLLHPDATERPTGTLAWLEQRDVVTHHHVRLGNDRDLRRVARRASGRAVGLVLGGGGARGFAHIGALRALEESGIEIDMVGGTSSGALISAAYAADISVAAMRELAETFASPKKLLDRTLPVVALMVGRKVTTFYRKVFGDLLIEDLWTPCFGVSSGLSRARAVVQRRGPVWRIVRASTALPAIFPPLLDDDGEVLVDGCVMNNMPLDVMRAQCEGGTVLGVNPMPTRDKEKSYSFGPSISGWRALLARFGIMSAGMRAPLIIGSVMRATEINSANRMRQVPFRQLADLLVEPAVEAYAILAFEQYAPIIDIGYAATKAQVASWQAATAAQAVV